MAEKVRLRLFRDNRTLEIILSASELQSYKRTGRSVRGFDNAIWERKRENAVLPGTFAIFPLNQEIKHRLLGTGNQLLLKPALLTRRGALASGRTTPTPMTPTCGEERTCSCRLFLPPATFFATIRTGWHTPPLLLNSALRCCPRDFMRLTPHR